MSRSANRVAWATRDLLGRPASPLAALLAALLVTASAGAANYVFDIEYLGDDNTSLAAGSDEPAGLTLLPGDTFQWTLTAQGDRRWRVDESASFFPLMAVSAAPPAERYGDYTLVLSNDGVEVFTESETNVFVQEVHVGTNGVVLPEGLEFDQMFLDYYLNSANDINPPFDDVGTTLGGRLPIFGAPENNVFSPGVSYIPEPTAVALLALASVVGFGVRRRA